MINRDFCSLPTPALTSNQEYVPLFALTHTVDFHKFELLNTWTALLGLTALHPVQDTSGLLLDGQEQIHQHWNWW